MKILCLYENACALPLFTWLEQRGHGVVLRKEKLDAAWCREQTFDLTVSYTYRHILTAEILEALGNNAVNLHNAYLPWNRGADPNIWSVLEGTPRGVSLHYIDTELDKGYLIAQQLVDIPQNATLRESYELLDCAAQALFRQAFCWYDYWPQMKKAALGRGTYHTVKDEQRFRLLLGGNYQISEKIFKEKYLIGGGYRLTGLTFDAALRQVRAA